MRVGLLLPNSNYIHRLAPDIRKWVDVGLDEGGVADREFFIETTTYNETKAAVRSALQDLLIKHEVNVVVAPFNPAMVADVEDLLGGQHVPLIMLTMGEDICQGDVAPPWVFCNSFNLWRSAWLAGWNAVEQFGKNAAIVTTPHAGGYGMAHAFSLGVEAAGGSIVATLPAGGELNQEQLNSCLITGHELDANVLIYVATASDHKHMAQAVATLDDPLPIICLPPHEYPGSSDDTQQERLSHTSIGCWAPDQSASRNFIERFSNDTERPAHAYALMAYEAGLLIAAASVANGRKASGKGFVPALANVIVDGPRGKVGFEGPNQEIITTQYVFEAGATDDATSAFKILKTISPPEVMSEHIQLARSNTPKHGWQNPYLIA